MAIFILTDYISISLNMCFNKNRRKWWGFYFKKREWNEFKVNFEFQKCNLYDLIYGFNGTGTSIKNKGLNKNLNEYLRGLKKYKHSEAWPLYQYMDDYKNWTDEFFIGLYSNPDKISNVLENKIKEITSLVENKGFKL